jgi:hypothetical protein
MGSSISLLSMKNNEYNKKKTKGTIYKQVVTVEGKEKEPKPKQTVLNIRVNQQFHLF